MQPSFDLRIRTMNKALADVVLPAIDPDNKAATEQLQLVIGARTFNVRDWSTDDDLWLRRLAIIAQLGRLADLDRDLLADVIEQNADDREFFIRKASGWALRDAARTDPEWVRAFVAAWDERPACVAIGETTASFARQEGFKPLVADTPDLEAMIRAAGLDPLPETAKTESES